MKNRLIFEVAVLILVLIFGVSFVLKRAAIKESPQKPSGPALEQITVDDLADLKNGKYGPYKGSFTYTCMPAPKSFPECFTNGGWISATAYSREEFTQYFGITINSYGDIDPDEVFKRSVCNPGNASCTNDKTGKQIDMVDCASVANYAVCARPTEKIVSKPLSPPIFLYNPFPLYTPATLVAVVEKPNTSSSEMGLDKENREDYLSGDWILKVKALNVEANFPQPEVLKEKELYIFAQESLMREALIYPYQTKIIKIRNCPRTSHNRPIINFFCAETISDPKFWASAFDTPLVNWTDSSASISLAAASLNQASSTLTLRLKAKSGETNAFCYDTLSRKLGILLDEKGTLIPPRPIAANYPASCITKNTELVDQPVVFENIPISMKDFTILIFDGSGNQKGFFTLNALSNGTIKVEPIVNDYPGS